METSRKRSSTTISLSDLKLTSQIDSYKNFEFTYAFKDANNCFSDPNGTCIMITDLKNSTKLWRTDSDKMAKIIMEHNFILRSIINKLLCKSESTDMNSIFKLNEIGDSWELAITGEQRFAKTFWIICCMLVYYTNTGKSVDNRPDIRIGVSSAPNITTSGILKKMFRNLNNMVLNYDQDNFYTEHIKRARNYESEAGVKDEEVGAKYEAMSSVMTSSCFINGLLNDLGINNKISDKAKRKFRLKGSGDGSGEINLQKLQDSIISPEYLKIDIDSTKIKEWFEATQKLLNVDANSVIENTNSMISTYETVIQAISSGYIMFIECSSSIKELFQTNINECYIVNSETLPVLLSIEGGGSVYNFYSENVKIIETLLNCLTKSPNIFNNIKISIANSNDFPIYKITDCPGLNGTCIENQLFNKYPLAGSTYSDNIKCKNINPIISTDFEEQQTFTRFISHTQNIAARMLYGKPYINFPPLKTNFGMLYTNDFDVLTKLKIDLQSSNLYYLKGLNPAGITVYSAKIN